MTIARILEFANYDVPKLELPIFELVGVELPNLENYDVVFLELVFFGFLTFRKF